jgi:hypothetical protein
MKNPWSQHGIGRGAGRYKIPDNTIQTCMEKTYCPRFESVVALLVLILLSIGMIMHALTTLSLRNLSAVAPEAYFFFLILVAVIVISGLVLVNMLFPERMPFPPPTD